MRQEDQRSIASEYPVINGVGVVSAAWLIFFVILAIHASFTSPAQRLAKAWLVQDQSEGEQGIAQAVRMALSTPDLSITGAVGGPIRPRR